MSLQGKLWISLIPPNAWGKNVRAIVSWQTWAELRWKFSASLNKPTEGGGYYCGKSISGKSYLTCSICFERYNDLHLHELWKFDDQVLVQYLIGFLPICEDCHNVIHYGRSQMVGLADRALQHLMKINQCSESEARAHINTAQREWMYRKNLRYEMDISYLFEKGLIKRNQVHMTWLERPTRVYERLDGVAWAKSLVGMSNAVILDTETTGLITGPLANPDAEIIELAIISMSGEILYNHRFKPIYEIPESAIQIHGITSKSVSKKPSFKKEYQKICDILHSKLIVAYNANFDRAVLQNTCRIHSLPMLYEVAWECAMWAYKGYLEYPKFLRLPDGTHSAVEDCQAVLKLIQGMAAGMED